ncbi:MAG: hypothetical protein RR540_01135 [Oscillospiraceae bacterium]
MGDLVSKNDCFKEAVCIEAQRIFDSCSDKDCLADLPVKLDPCYEIDENVTIVKSKCVEVSDVCVNVEPIPFNKGFYSVDITYTFRLALETYEKACEAPSIVYGTAVFCKKVILFGSVGNTKTFCSNGDKFSTTNVCGCEVSLPKACVQVVEPMVLDAKLVCKSKCYCENEMMPEMSKNCCQCERPKRRHITVTLGLFSVIQLTRAVSVLVPIYDYCIPRKECTGLSDSPCEIFDKIKFPTDEFFPPALQSDDDDCSCGS